jgi:hypothetical protein
VRVPCKKKTVIAIILAPNGDYVVGDNFIENVHVTECPRLNGEGYEKCKSVCQQEDHAEIMAIKKAKERMFDLDKCKIILANKKKMCSNCLREVKKEGLEII